MLRTSHSRRLAVLVVGLSLIGCEQAPTVDLDAERAAATQREQGLLAALSAKDAESLIGFFAEDAVLHIANQPAIVGREAISEFYGNVFRFLSSSESSSEGLEVSSGGDMAFSTGRSENLFGGPQGTVRFIGKYVLIWAKRGGEWQAVVYSLSNDAAEGEPVEGAAAGDQE